MQFWSLTAVLFLLPPPPRTVKHLLKASGAALHKATPHLHLGASTLTRGAPRVHFPQV